METTNKKIPKIRKRKKHFIDIAYVRESLNEVQKHFPEINKQLTDYREELDDTVKKNMIAAYRYLNRILQEKKDIFHKDVSNPFYTKYRLAYKRRFVFMFEKSIFNQFA